jgi:hypothetical protein
MPGFRIDLGKLTSRVPVPRAVGKAFGAASRAVDRWEGALDRATSPLVAAKVRGCKVECGAELLGIADLPRLEQEHASGIDVALLRLRVLRPGGDAECCVRQNVPHEVRRVIVPGFGLVVMAHESDPAIAVVDWDATAYELETPLRYVIEMAQFAWPDPPDWPAAGAIEIRDNWRHRKRIEDRRATWRPTGARLAGAESRGARTDGREDWHLRLQLADGRVASIKERVPDLALARLVARKEGGGKLGGMVASVDTVVRVGAPIAVLVSPGGEVAVDWEATLRYPELNQPEPL